jgi:hypothetical protein
LIKLRSKFWDKKDTKRMLIPRRAFLKGAALATPAVIHPDIIEKAIAGTALSQSPASTGFTSPYSPASPWNCRPIKPVLGKGVINTSKNYPFLDEGKDGQRFYLADANCPARNVTVRSLPDAGLSNQTVSMPRWPDRMTPTGGSDHTLAIYDPVDGVVSEFWIAIDNSGSWSATNFAATSSDGSGWPSPAHPYSGIAAPGCPVSGGMLRQSEATTATIKHALSCALDPGSLISGPVWPACLQDYDALNGLYTGALPNAFPIGTLFMLPSSFDLSWLTSANYRVMAQALMTYGIYLINAATGTFSISVESSYGRVGGWANDFNNLRTIQHALRPMVSCGGWIDAVGNTVTDGRPTSPTAPNLATPFLKGNIMNMGSGPWGRQGASGTPIGKWNSQADLGRGLYVAPVGPGGNDQCNRYPNDYSTAAPGWWWKWNGNSGWYINPTLNQSYLIKAIGHGNMSISIMVADNSGRDGTYFNVTLDPGQEVRVTWPNASNTYTRVLVHCGPAGGGIRAEMYAVA